MSKIKEYVRHLAVVAMATLLAQCAWAEIVVGTQLVESNLDAGITSIDGASNVIVNKLLVSPREGLPTGSKVTIQSIGFAYRTSYHPYLVLSQGGNASRASTSNATSTKTVTKADGTTQNVNWIEYIFNNLEVTVGEEGPCYQRAGAGGGSVGEAKDLALCQPTTFKGVQCSNYANRSMIYEIKYTVESFPEIITATLNASSANLSEIQWSATPAADKLLELTLTQDTVLTIDSLPEMLAFAVKKDSSVEGNVSLKIVAKANIVNASLGDGVTYTDFEIPADASDTIKAMNLPVPAGKTLTIVGTEGAAEPLTLTGILTVNGALKTKGNVRITPGTNNGTGSIIESGATMEVVSGTTAMKFNDRGLRGTLTIDAGATLKPIDYVDACKYDGSSTVNVYGTLDMSDSWARWTLRSNNVMNFFTGSKTIGNGQSGNNTGAIQFNSTGCVLHFKKSGTEDGTIQFDPLLHAQQAFTIDVDAGVTVTMANGMGTSKEPATFAGVGKTVISSAYAFNKAITVSSGATLELAENGSVQNGAVGEGNVIFSGAAASLGTSYRDPKLSFAAGSVINVTASESEKADGAVVLKTTMSSVDGLTFNVGETTIESEDVALDAEAGTITLKLVTQSVKTTSNVSEWDSSWAGTVSVKNDDPENAITMTIDAAFPAGVDTVNVFGKVDIVYTESASAEQSVTISLQPGSEGSVTGVIANTISVQSEATLKTTGAVASAGKITNSGTLDVVDGTLTLSSGTVGGTIIIRKDAKIVTTATNALASTIVLHNYGTLDISGANHQDINSAPACSYNLYAGSSIVGGETGKLVMTGGYSNTINVKAFDGADSNTVAFDVIYQTSGYGSAYSTVFQKDAANLDITFKSFTYDGSVIVKGANNIGWDVVRGQCTVSSERSLKGDIVVGTGATLNITGGDAFEYETNKANLDVYGTINVNANRQTLSSSTQSWGAGAIKLHDGAQIIGAGASHKSTTVGLDIWNATTIEVDGTVTISTPIYGEVARSSVSFVKAEGAETAVVNMTGNNTLNGGFKVGEGVVVDCGTDKATKYAVTLEGGTLKWAGAGNAHGSLVKSVTLTADSRIESTTAGGFVGVGVGGSAETTIDLASHKLTMKAAQASDRVYFDKTSITSAGTLEIEQGVMFVHCKHLATVDDVDLVIGANASVQNAGDQDFDGDRSMTVRNLTYNGTAPTGEYLKLIVTGVFSGTGTIGQLELADGATIAVAEIPEGGVVASATNSLTINDISTIKLTIDGEETSDYTLSVNGTSVIAAPAEITFTLTTLPEHAVAYIQINNGETTPIEGGTFTATPGDQFVVWFAPAEGYVGKTLSTGVVTVVYPMQTTEIQSPTAEMMNIRPVVAVAAVGEPSMQPEIHGFGSLGEAIAAGWYVFLTDAVTVDSTIVIDHSVVIDLQGHNVTGNGVRVFQVKSGTVEIDSTDADSGNVISATISTTGEINPDSSVIRIGGGDASSAPELTIDEGVTISSAVCYGITAFGVGTQTLVVDGTVSTTGNRPAISGNGNASNGETTITINGTVSATAENAIYQPQAGTTTINGTVTGGIEAKAGAVTIKSGAMVTARETTATHTANGDGCSTQGYAVAVVDNAGYKGGAVVTIEGGTITGPVAQVVDSKAKEANTLTITGGTFTIDPSAYVADGYEATESEGVWTVSEKTGPKSWDEVDKDTELSEVVSAETLVSLEGSSVTAMDIAAWAKANEVAFQAGITVPVNALIFYCAPDAIPMDVKAEADKALKQVAVDMDLLALMKEATEKGSVTIPAPEPNPYPLAVFKLVPATLGDGVVTTAELFKLSIELK